MEDIERGKEATNNLQKSYFDVLGICCPSEVPLIDNILKPLDGVMEVNVIVPSRTVIVIHDNHIISQIQIVKALNSARLEANVRVYGEQKHGQKWPSPYTIGCGVLVCISTFKFLFHPLAWVGLAAVVIGIPPILFRCVAAVRNCTVDVNILVFIAVVGAIILQDFWEAGTVVFLFTIAEWLELRASHKATAMMSSLMSMAPQKAILAETGETIDPKDVNIGMVLAVKAGEVIPMDGVVVEGNCEVDEKSLTGEPLPVFKPIESTVWAGTINVNGYISIRATALAEDSMVAKMAKLVEEAQNNKSKTQRLVDQFAKYYTPAIMLASISLIVVPAALRKPDLKHWAHLALVVLVSACPCSLVLSTPVATFCAFTKAATAGILLKGGDYLEILAKVKVMAFDKTGTITRGEFSVTHFQSVSSDVSLNTLLYWVSSIESKASHPMAAALVDHAQFNTVEPKPENVTEFQNFPGEGIFGTIDGKNVYIGNRRIATRVGCNTALPQGDEKDRGTLGYIFCGENLVGFFNLADTCRFGVLEAINKLKSMGIRTAMLTGDSQIAAMRVQDKLGQALDEVHAELLPEDKARIIKNLKREGPTAMIGDGVNDAPALATADIGISMGISGSALATETGHITLMSNDIRKIPLAIKLARKTLWKIRQNVILSVATKAAILTLAFCGHPLLWAAVLTDVGTCLLVIMNSMLLLQGTNTSNGKSHRHTCAQNKKGHGSHSKGHGSHSKGHGSHGGCGHNKHACGSKVEHGPCSHPNQIQEKTCSQGDRSSTCCHNEDQTPKVRCQNPSSGGCGTSSHVKDNNHGFCCSIAHDVSSHVIEINKAVNRAQTCEDCSTGEVSCSPKNHQHCPETSQHTKHACHGHSISANNETNHVNEDIHPEGHGDLNMKHHHHHQTPHACHGHSVSVNNETTHVEEDIHPEEHGDLNMKHHHHHQTPHACHGHSVSANNETNHVEEDIHPEGHGDLNLKHHHHRQTPHACHGHSTSTNNETMHIHDDINPKKHPEGHHCFQNVQHHHVGLASAPSGCGFHRQGRHVDCQTCRIPEACISIS